MRNLRHAAVMAAIVLSIGLGSAQAAVIVDYFDTDETGSFGGVTSLANNDGWDIDGYFSGSGYASVKDSSLNFSNTAYDDADSGNKAGIGLDGRGFGREFASAWSGTIWMSYLVEMTKSGNSPEAGIRSERWTGYGASVDGVNYIWNDDDSVYEAGTAALNLNETYLAIARFDVSDSGSSLTAWHFAEGDTIPTTEAGLDALTANVLTRSGLNHLDAGTAGATGFMGKGMEVDSVRLSNDDGDTGLQNTMIPEPATMAMLGIGGLAALLRRRKA